MRQRHALALIVHRVHVMLLELLKRLYVAAQIIQLPRVVPLGGAIHGTLVSWTRRHAQRRLVLRPTLLVLAEPLADAFRIRILLPHRVSLVLQIPFDQIPRTRTLQPDHDVTQGCVLVQALHEHLAVRVQRPSTFLRLNVYEHGMM